MAIPPIDQAPGVIATPQRNDIRDQFLTDYALRVPAADVGPNTQPYADASIAADTIVPLYADAITIGRGTNLATSGGVWLDEIGTSEGVAKRPAVGAAGFVTIIASTGGTNILAGTELRERVKQTRYRVTATSLYLNGGEVPVQGIDTGPTTNQPVGATLVFQAPPPGCGPNAIVAADSDGNGLIGGRPADDDTTYRALITSERSNPPASGNDAEYQQGIRKTPAVSIQQVFTYPGILGPGTTAYCFTLNPSSPGRGRVPNNAQIMLTYSYIVGREPADDGVFACNIVEIPTRVLLRVTWRVGAAAWLDAAPWPQYASYVSMSVTVPDPVIVSLSPPPTLTTMRLYTVAGTVIANPQAGQTIGFYDGTAGVFRRIRIGAVAIVVSGTTWDITIDRTNNASDPSYIPAISDVASPWSDSLTLVASTVIGYFDTLGPGEQKASLPDPGLRQRRQPEDPLWPSIVDNRLLAPLLTNTPAVRSPTLLEPAIPFATPVGVQATYSNLLVLGQLAVYP